MEQSSICISEEGRSFIDNSTFYNDNPVTTFSSIVSTNRQTDAINLYLLPTTATAFGRADGIPSNASVISGSYVLTGVVTHEFGHCLGLFHTHRGTVIEGGSGPPQCPELVNGINSTTCGDYVPDTPADPSIWLGCSYAGTVTDANGQAYAPLTDNIMSYVSPICLQNFTTLQTARMHTAINNSTVLQSALAKITGPSQFCTTTPYSIPNLPSGATVTWTAAGSISISGANNINPVSVTKSTNGTGTLTANISTAWW